MRIFLHCTLHVPIRLGENLEELNGGGGCFLIGNTYGKETIDFTEIKILLGNFVVPDRLACTVPFLIVGC